jgi:molybdate transport system substrate-binding protein
MTALKVLCSIALQNTIVALRPELEKRVGCEIHVRYGVATTFKKNIDDGESFDVAILTRSVIEDLVIDGRIVISSYVDVARSGLGLAVRLNAPKPEIGSIEALKRTLLAAASVASSKNGLAGFYFMEVLEDLGIAQQIRPKLKLETAGGYAAEITARGDAEMAVQLVSEILPVAGVELVGSFPPALQRYAILSAGVSTLSSRKMEAAAIIEFLMDPITDAALLARGLERCEQSASIPPIL